MEGHDRSQPQWQPHQPYPGRSDASLSLVSGARSERKSHPPHFNAQYKCRAGHTVRAQTRNRRGPGLLVEAENEAAALWRHHQPLADTIILPTELIVQENTYERLAYEVGSFIECTELIDGDTRAKFGLWGTHQQVAAAKNAILKWIREVRGKGRRRENFEKLASLLPLEKLQKEKEFNMKVKQQRFRQLPPPDMGFGAVGSFHWPVSEYRPEEVFGVSFEALDEIRMQCSCYVVFIKERSAFQVCGKEKGVQNALIRIRMTYFQIVARMMNPTRTSLLHWPISEDIPSHVSLSEYRFSEMIPSDKQSKGPANVRELGYSPCADGILEDEIKINEERSLSASNVEWIGEQMMQTLRQTHFYRGNIEIRLRLGTFLLDQYLPPNGEMYTLEEYELMMKLAQFSGSVTEELGDQRLEQYILPALLQAHHVISPIASLTEKLETVEPTYSAAFTFSDTGGDIQLDVTWHALDVGEDRPQYELSEVAWSRLDCDTGQAHKLFDVSLTDLHTSSSWQFDILTSDTLDRSKAPIYLQSFASQIRLRLPSGRDPGAIVLDPSVLHPPSTKLKFLRQQSTFRYALRGTDYHLLLARFQDRTFMERNPLLQRAEVKLFEPRWALGVTRMEWKTNLSANARLPIGARADWSDKLEEWFPVVDPAVPGNGFTQLVARLHDIMALVRQSVNEIEEMGGTAEMFHGMRIG